MSTALSESVHLTRLELGDPIPAGDAPLFATGYSRLLGVDADGERVGFWPSRWPDFLFSAKTHGPDRVTYDPVPVSAAVVGDPYDRWWLSSGVDHANLSWHVAPARRAACNPFSYGKEQGFRPHVYFIRAANGLTKVGVSRNVRGRFASLQCMSPISLRLVAVIPHGGEETERTIHENLQSTQSHGEWFRESDSLDEWIDMAVPAGAA
jgi:hypothetical protein